MRKFVIHGSFPWGQARLGGVMFGSVRSGMARWGLARWGDVVVAGSKKLVHREHLPTRLRKARFLALIRKQQHPHIGLACEKIGISRQAVEKWRKTDPKFLREYDECFECIADTLENVLMQQAKDGSFQAAAFMLRGIRGEKYRDRSDSKIDVAVRRPAIGNDLPGELPRDWPEGHARLTTELAGGNGHGGNGHGGNGAQS